MAEISICIPTYNGAEHLHDCLDSVTSQTFEDLEIVVVDDDSSDETCAIIESYAAFDQRVKLFRNSTNLGLVGNWNRAVQLCTSPWIKLLFQDDFILPDCVGKLRVFAEQTGVPFVACFREFLFERDESDAFREIYLRNRKLVASAFQGCDLISAERVAELSLDYFAENIVGEPTVTLMHRSVFDMYGYFDPAIASRCDIEFWARVGIQRGIGMLQAPLAVFRVHTQSTTMQNVAKRHFAVELLDRLVILFRYVYGEEYAALREVAIRRGVLETMKQSLRELFVSAKKMALAHRSNRESGIWEDWVRVRRYYPALDSIA